VPAITLNGDPYDTDALTVAALLERLDIDARRVAVERNFIVVKRDAYAVTPIETGDQIEVVNFVGGGSGPALNLMLHGFGCACVNRRSGVQKVLVFDFKKNSS